MKMAASWKKIPEEKKVPKIMGSWAMLEDNRLLARISALAHDQVSISVTRLAALAARMS